MNCIVQYSDEMLLLFFLLVVVVFIYLFIYSCIYLLPFVRSFRLLILESEHETIVFQTWLLIGLLVFEFRFI